MHKRSINKNKEPIQIVKPLKEKTLLKIINTTNAKVFFEYGVEYTIGYSFGVPGEVFKTGQKLIYISESPECVAGYTRYCFYDLSNGKTRIWNLDHAELEIQLEAIPKKFKISGGWPKPKLNLYSQPAGNVFSQSLPAVLKQYIPYFKSIAEGREGIENWFIFFYRNNYVFENVVSAAEYQRWKNYPYGEIELFLEKEKITFTPHLRYQWLKQ